MEYFYYYIFFPEGESQEIFHPLVMGDIVDVNGNVYSPKELDPKKIAYKISSVKKESKFKETFIYYRLELLNRDEVSDEVNFVTYKKKKQNYDEIFLNLEKKLKKKKGIYEF